MQKKNAPYAYDLIVVPGLKLGPNWGLRKDLRARLTLAAKLYYENPGVRIAVCGKWSIWYDWWGIQPPVTEYERMKAYLVRHGVKARDIITESRSKDTAGNVYYLKRHLRVKPNYRRLLIICAAQHKTRLEFLFYKFFGKEYSIEFLGVEVPNHEADISGDEVRILAEHRALLAGVRPGHEEDFKHKFYKCAYYTRHASVVRASNSTK